MDVVIDPVSPHDAGEYRCGGTAISHLVVLAVVPNCTIELIGDLDLTSGGQISMRCKFNWTTKLDPDLPWIDPAGHSFIQTHLSAAVGQTVFDRSFLVARLIATEDDQTKWFNVSIAAEPPDPRYDFNWSNANVNVLMSVRNVSIRAIGLPNCCSTNEENLLHEGDQLMCRADGRPEVQYRWEEVSEGTVRRPYVHSPQYTLQRPGKHLLRCMASNRIRDKSYNESEQITVHVEVPLPTDYKNPTRRTSSPEFAASVLYLVAGLSAAVVVVVVVVVVAAACVVDRRRNKPPDRRRDTEVDGEEARPALPAVAAAVAAGPEPPATDPHRRRSLPLPAITESQTTQHDEYDDVEDQDDAVTTDPTADDRPDVEETPATSEPVTPDGVVRLQEETDPYTAPKSFYEPLITLELRSTEVPAGSKPHINEYIRILDSKATSTDDLCCTEAVILTQCVGQNPETVVQ